MRYLNNPTAAVTSDWSSILPSLIHAGPITNMMQ